MHRITLKPKTIKSLIESSGFTEEEIAKKAKILVKFLKELKIAKSKRTLNKTILYR